MDRIITQFRSVENVNYLSSILPSIPFKILYQRVLGFRKEAYEVMESDSFAQRDGKINFWYEVKRLNVAFFHQMKTIDHSLKKEEHFPMDVLMSEQILPEMNSDVLHEFDCPDVDCQTWDRDGICAIDCQRQSFNSLNFLQKNGTQNLQYQRYKSIPVWQRTKHLKRGVELDIEDTLGHGTREAESHIRRWEF